MSGTRPTQKFGGTEFYKNKKSIKDKYLVESQKSCKNYKIQKRKKNINRGPPLTVPSATSCEAR